MFSAVTGWVSGHTKKKRIGVTKMRATILIARPYLPRDQRRGGSGAPQRRRHIKQQIVMVYENRIEVPPSELIAFKAVEDPMLMSDNKLLTTKETQTARSGMFQPGDTLDSHAEPGRPPSRAKDQICRDAVATSLIQAEVSMMIMITVITVAPA